MKNPTVSSNVKSRPSCRYGGESFMPRRGNVLRLVKALHLQIVHGVVRILRFLGDHDPSGWHTTQNLREEISTYARHPAEVRRLGLNLDQITDLGLPPNPAKETDKRYAAYVRETGQTSSWELDALSPPFIDGLVERAIHDLVDMDRWNEALAHEEAQRERLHRLARRWAK